MAQGNLGTNGTIQKINHLTTNNMGKMKEMAMPENEENTRCGNPHNHKDPDEPCNECLAIIHNI